MGIIDKIIGPARPLTWALQFLPVLVMAFAGALPATWFCKKIALKYGITDKPDDLVKTHAEPIAYLGGVGIMVGITVGILGGILLLDHGVSYSRQLRWLIGILAGGAVACFVGLVDDILDISPKKKILGQVGAAVLLLAVGIVPNVNALITPFGLALPDTLHTVIQVVVVVFFVVGATNSLNLLDGLDGLCGGVTAIITVALLLLAVHLATWEFSETGDPVRIIVCLGLVGAVCGFLPFNRHPAKIFMGDAGSMLLGFIIAALMILFAEQIPRWWMASVIVFGLPILDTGVALVRRLLNHRPLMVSDRGHIYDQMIDRGIPLKKTVKISYMLAGMYALIGLLMSQVRTRYAAVIYLLVIIVSALVVWKKGYLKMEGLHGRIPQSD